jgi:hypothetical protein
MEEARQAVLKTSRFDAPLSDKGEREAAAARKLIQELTCGKNGACQDTHCQCRKTCQVLLDSITNQSWPVPLSVSLKVVGCHHRRKFWSVPCNEPCKLPIWSFLITAIFEYGMNYGSD